MIRNGSPKFVIIVVFLMIIDKLTAVSYPGVGVGRLARDASELTVISYPGFG